MPNWSDDEGRPSEDSPLKRQKMTVWIYSETDGDAGDYNIAVFSTLELAETHKVGRDKGYGKIREYEVDKKVAQKEPYRHDEVMCPDCGGKMTSRTGQYGKFWGCNNYPTCKGTRDSQGRSKEDRRKWKEAQEIKVVEDDIEKAAAGSEWRRNEQDGIRWKK